MRLYAGMLVLGFGLGLSACGVQATDVRTVQEAKPTVVEPLVNPPQINPIHVQVTGKSYVLSQEDWRAMIGNILALREYEKEQQAVIDFYRSLNKEQAPK